MPSRSQLQRKESIYVVIRLDLPLDGPGGVQARINLVEAFRDPNEADAEVERLNSVNSDKQCEYFCAGTRFFPDGRNVEVRY